MKVVIIKINTISQKYLDETKPYLKDTINYLKNKIDEEIN